MSVFLENQINYCKAGIFIENNLSQMYGFCANSFRNDLLRFSFELKQKTILCTVKGKEKKENLIFYNVKTRQEAIITKSPLGLSKLIESLPKEFQNFDFKEILTLFYFEVIVLELTFDSITKDHPNKFVEVQTKARDSIIKIIMRQHVLESCDKLDFEGSEVHNWLPVFSLDSPSLIRMGRTVDGRSVEFKEQSTMTLEKKLKSLVQKEIYPSLEYALH